MKSDNEETLRPEPTKGKGLYRITLTVPGDRITAVKKRTEQLYPDCEIEVENELATQTRAERLQEAQWIVQELHDELEEWLDNMPENLQSGEKAEELQQCISDLDSIITEMEGIEFPSMR